MLSTTSRFRAVDRKRREQERINNGSAKQSRRSCWTGRSECPWGLSRAHRGSIASGWTLRTMSSELTRACPYQRKQAGCRCCSQQALGSCSSASWWRMFVCQGRQSLTCRNKHHSHPSSSASFEVCLYWTQVPTEEQSSSNKIQNFCYVLRYAGHNSVSVDSYQGEAGHCNWGVGYKYRNRSSCILPASKCYHESTSWSLQNSASLMIYWQCQHRMHALNYEYRRQNKGYLELTCDNQSTKTMNLMTR